MSMGTTTSDLKNPATWLKIGLECQRQESKIELFITFTNTTAVAHDFSFSNQTHKAELLGLHISTLTGQRVIPTHNLVIKPSKLITGAIILKAGTSFPYTLTGELTNYGVEFPGAIFELTSGETYQLQFRYAGQKSNIITFLC